VNGQEHASPLGHSGVGINELAETVLNSQTNAQTAQVSQTQVSMSWTTVTEVRVQPMHSCGCSFATG